MRGLLFLMDAPVECRLHRRQCVKRRLLPAARRGEWAGYLGSQLRFLSLSAQKFKKN